MRSALAALLCAVVVLVLPAAAGSEAAPHRGTGREPYPWPLKPFDRPHPIRGNFNDPRVEFVGEDLSSNFHFGVDISAPDLAPVYAVAPGIASRHRDYVDVLTVGADESAPSRRFRMSSSLSTGRFRRAHGQRPCALIVGADESAP